MASVDMCEHDWSGSGCKECRVEREKNMTDQKQAPERITLMRRIGEGSLHVPEQGETMSWGNSEYAEFVRKDLHDAAIKKRDELAAELREAEDRANKFATKEMHTEKRALKAEAERDELEAKVERLSVYRYRAGVADDQLERLSAMNCILERKLDQALAASAAREIAMRDRAADMVDRRNSILEVGTELSSRIRALPLSPDGQQALDDVRADAWDEGYDQALKDDFGSKGYTQNPYRKPSRSSDAGKSEDRG